MRFRSFLFGVFVSFFLPQVAGATTISVPGTSDPWLAGMPAGSTASSGDVAPDESPVLVTGITLTPGEVLTFSTIGSVSNTPSPSGVGPDGGGFFDHFAGAENGISNIVAPLNSLLGVFLSDVQPDSNAAPATLDFGVLGLDYLSLSPTLQQVFFIGDGENSTFTQQEYVIPVGATRLYLGTMDGFGWFNNSGSFEVTIKGGGQTPPLNVVPLPAGMVLMLTGLGGFASMRRRA